MKRYPVTLDLYVYANSDEEAIVQAKQIATERRNKFDDECKILTVHQQTGTNFLNAGIRKVYDSQD